MIEKYYYNKFSIKYFWGREDENNRRQAKGRTWIYLLLFLSKMPFLNIHFFLNKHIHFLVHGHSFRSTSGLFTPSEAPESFVNGIFFQEIGPRKSDHGKKAIFHGPSDFMVHGGSGPVVTHLAMKRSIIHDRYLWRKYLRQQHDLT